MGEETWSICISGEPCLDNILSYSLPSKEEFLEKWNLNNSSPFVLSTFHSETILQGIGADFIEKLTHSILNKTDFQILFTAANTDEGGILINQKLEALSEKNPRVKFVKSLGKTNYYAALKYADMVLGNSSSGLVEAQSFKVPVINVGSRQDGRLRNVNVFDVKPITEEILDAIAYVKTQSFESKYKNHQNIYGDGQSLSRIVDFLKNLDWSKLLLKRSTFPTD